jgi:hypothetical protein
MRFIDFKVITTLALLVFLSSLYLFVDTDQRADIFLFYDYVNLRTGVKGRLVVNILNDLSQLITIFTLLFLWYKTASFKSLKNVLLPFVIVSGLDIIDYILFYQQNSIIKLPILIVLILVFNLKKFIKK